MERLPTITRIFVIRVSKMDRDTLRGFDDDSGPVEVVQHHSRFNVMLLPVKNQAQEVRLALSVEQQRSPSQWPDGFGRHAKSIPGISFAF